MDYPMQGYLGKPFEVPMWLQVLLRQRLLGSDSALRAELHILSAEICPRSRASKPVDAKVIPAPSQLRNPLYYYLA